MCGTFLPEDTQGRSSHFAPYPVDLCYIPILATCPEGGMVLDPFCGTGTTLLAARNLGRRSVGIDISGRYLSLAQERCASLLMSAVAEPVRSIVGEGRGRLEENRRRTGVSLSWKEVLQGSKE